MFRRAESPHSALSIGGSRLSQDEPNLPAAGHDSALGRSHEKHMVAASSDNGPALLSLKARNRREIHIQKRVRASGLEKVSLPIGLRTFESHGVLRLIKRVDLRPSVNGGSKVRVLPDEPATQAVLVADDRPG